MNLESLSGHLDELRQVKSKDRHRIYDQIVDMAMIDPFHLTDVVQQLSSSQDFYAQSALEKIAGRVHDRFLKSDHQPTRSDMAHMISQANTPQQDILLSALRGYLDRPVSTLSPENMTTESIFAAGAEAIAITEPLALALAQEEDSEKRRIIITAWREFFESEEDYTIAEILGIANHRMPGEAGEKAAAIRDILNSIEVMYFGEYHYGNEDVKRIDSTREKVWQFTKVLGEQGANTPVKMIDLINHQVIVPNVQAVRKGRRDFNYCSVEGGESELINTAVLQNMKKWGVLLSHEGVEAFTLKLPGNHFTLIMNRNEKTEDELASFVEEQAWERIRVLQEKREKGEQIPPITIEEMGALFDFCMPNITSPGWKEEIEMMKQEAAAGLYSLSKRGDRIVFDKKTELEITAIGIDSLVFKKQGQDTLVTFNLFGSPIQCRLDDEYSLHIDGMMSPKAMGWLQTIVYSYLSELRNNKSGQVTSQDVGTNPTPEGTPPAAGREYKGVRPYLRVLAEGYHTTINQELNDQVRDIFGYSLSEINTYFGLAQMRRETVDELPPKLGRMIENLLERISRKGVSPRWVQEPAPLMLLDSPRYPQQYHPLTSVFRVSFVDEFQVENTDPKEVRCPGGIEKIQEIVGSKD